MISLKFSAFILICVAIFVVCSSNLNDLPPNIESFLSLPFFQENDTPSYSCPKPLDQSKKLNDFHIRGTCLGGFLVLEPWLTPSLFYQFLGASDKWGDDAKDHVGLDCLTFCTALGPKEANRQLRNHWKTWVDENQIRNLANMGVKHLRIPVADWMFVPYEPFIGCWDGSLEELDRVLQLCRKYNIKAIIDLHAVKKSQV
jgi:glucan 1,3-beta-glucosidase